MGSAHSSQYNHPTNPNRITPFNPNGIIPIGSAHPNGITPSTPMASSHSLPPDHLIHTNNPSPFTPNKTTPLNPNSITPSNPKGITAGMQGCSYCSGSAHRTSCSCSAHRPHPGPGCSRCSSAAHRLGCLAASSPGLAAWGRPRSCTTDPNRHEFTPKPSPRWRGWGGERERVSTYLCVAVWL